MAEATPLLPGLSPVWTKSLTATRDAGNLSSNGGLVVLREAARRLDLAAVIADPLPDRPNPSLIYHSYRAMVTARMMAIADEAEQQIDLLLAHGAVGLVGQHVLDGLLHAGREVLLVLGQPFRRGRQSAPAIPPAATE